MIPPSIKQSTKEERRESHGNVCMTVSRAANAVS